MKLTPADETTLTEARALAAALSRRGSGKTFTLMHGVLNQKCYPPVVVMPNASMASWLKEQYPGNYEWTTPDRIADRRIAGRGNPLVLDHTVVSLLLGRLLDIVRRLQEQP